ncbi:diguanylate cyclase domain-containing protein [Deinococcus altitudinis]|uniref:sensor domain-containing diguanylate cyclase n=1 Tax=Deinococcus altitudinis TaxID=468914 RepID=UPI003891E9BC
MIAVPIPENEPSRLRALQRYEGPDSIPHEAFGSILQLVTDILGLPMVSINFIDEVQHFAKASLGMELLELPRNESFCAWAILSPEVMVVPDLQADARFHDHPLVRPQHAPGEAEEGLRTYAGAPITTPDGERIGTLCVAGGEVHDLNDRERSILASLAALVMDELELRLRERELEEAISYSRVLAGVSGLGEQELLADQMAQNVAELLSQVIALDWVGLTELRSGTLHLTNEWNAGRLDPLLDARLRLGVSPDTGLIARSLKSQAAVFVDHYAEHPDAVPALAEAGLGGVACLYLTGGGGGESVSGGGAPQLLLALRQRSDSWTEAEQALFKAAARSLRIALERQQRMQDMQQAAYTDGLTGLRNRRSFDQTIGQLSEQGRPYSVVMVDLDGMKTINDTLGHAEGDLLLQTFARQLTRGLHDSDRAYRFGGDEFALLLSDLPPDEATLDRIIRERIGRTVKGTQASGFPGVDASFGWAMVPGHALSGTEALELADQRMYGQKTERGRRTAPAAQTLSTP